MRWWSILEAMRSVAARKGEFSSRDLAPAAELSIGVASGWLSKFVRWGYARRVGSEAGNGRWLRLYSITRYGATRKPPAGSPDWPVEKKRKQFRKGRAR